MYGHVSYRVATKRLKLLRQQLTLKSYKVVVCCARRQRVSRITCLPRKQNILIAAKEFKRKLFTDFNTFNDPLSRFNCWTWLQHSTLPKPLHSMTVISDAVNDPRTKAQHRATRYSQWIFNKHQLSVACNLSNHNVIIRVIFRVNACGMKHVCAWLNSSHVICMNNIMFVFSDNSQLDAQVPASFSSCSSQWRPQTSIQSFQNFCLQRNRVHCSYSLPKWKGITYNTSIPRPHATSLNTNRKRWFKFIYLFNL